jgi:hypothetical protein
MVTENATSCWSALSGVTVVTGISASATSDATQTNDTRSPVFILATSKSGGRGFGALATILTSLWLSYSLLSNADFSSS